MSLNKNEKVSEDKQQHRLYNPYQDLEIPARKLHQLPTQPEFLFHEESLRERRSWGENLTYNTGGGYLTGATTGAARGFFDATRAFEGGDTFKLRVNRVLNACGLNGRQWGNRVGVVGLMYAGLESGMFYLRDFDDVFNSVAAGLATGALYKAASGPRAAAVSAAIGGLLVGSSVAFKHAFKRYLPL